MYIYVTKKKSQKILNKTVKCFKIGTIRIGVTYVALVWHFSVK